MEVQTATSRLASVPQVPSLIETREKASSSVIMTSPLSKTEVDECTEPSISRLAVADDQVEMMKATYEDKIAKIHENYQYIIDYFLLIYLFFLYLFYLERKYVD